MADVLDKKHAQVNIIKEAFPGITEEGIKYVLANIEIEGGGGREVAYPLNDDENSMFDLSDAEGTRGGYLHNIPTARVFMVENGYAEGEIYDRGGGTMDVRPGTFKRNEKSTEYDAFSNSQKLGVMYNGDPSKPAGGYGPLQITLGKVAGGEEREKQLREQYKKSGHEGDFNSYLEKIENDDDFGLRQTLEFYKTNDPNNWNAESISAHENAAGLGRVINPNRGETDTLMQRYDQGYTSATDTMSAYNAAFPTTAVEGQETALEGIDPDEPYQRDGKMYKMVNGVETEITTPEAYVPPQGDIQQQTLLNEVTVSGNQSQTVEGEEYVPPQGDIQQETLTTEIQVEGNIGTPFNKPETDEQIFTAPSATDQITDPEINVGTSTFLESAFATDNDLDPIIGNTNSLLNENNSVFDFSPRINSFQQDTRPFINFSGDRGVSDQNLTTRTVDGVIVPNTQGRQSEVIDPATGQRYVDPGTVNMDDASQQVGQVLVENNANEISSHENYVNNLEKIKQYESDPQVQARIQAGRELPGGEPIEIQNARDQVNFYNGVADEIMKDTNVFGGLQDEAEESGLTFDPKKYKDQLRVEIIKELSDQNLIGKASNDNLTDEEKEYIGLAARRRVLEKNNEHLIWEAEQLNIVGDEISQDINQVQNTVDQWKADADNLKSEWNNKIKPTGFYTYYGGVEKWNPNFKNASEQTAYSDFIEKQKNLEEKRIIINDTNDEVLERHEWYQTKVEKHKKNKNELYEALAFNEQELAFKPMFPDTRFVVSKDGKDFVVSNKFNESLRDLAGRDNEWGMFSDVISSTASNVLEFRAFLSRAALIPAAISGGTLAILSQFERYQGGYGGYTVFDSWVDKFAMLSKTNVLPTAKDPDANLFVNKPIKGQIFPYVDWSSSPYAYGKFASELFPYTIMLIGGIRKFDAKRTVNQRARLREVVKAGKQKQFRRLGVVSVGNYGTLLKPTTLVKSLQNKFTMTRKLANNLKQIDLTYRMLLSQNLAYARSEGLDGEEAFAMASWMSFMTGVSQSIMPDYLWFQSAAGVNMMKKLPGMLKKIKSTKGITNKANILASQKAVTTLVKSTFKEIFEEELDVALNDVVKSSYLANHSPEIFDVKQQNQLLVGTLMLSGVMGSVQGIKTFNHVKHTVYNQYIKDTIGSFETVDAELKAVEDEISRLEGYEKSMFKLEGWEKIHLQELKKSKEQLEKAKDFAFELVKAIKMAPELVTTDAIDLLMEKNKLIKEKNDILKDKDKVAVEEQVKEIDQKIEEVNKKIREESFTVKKDQLNALLKERGRKLAGDEGFLYHETSAEEYFEFVKIENARRIRENNKIDAEIDVLEKDGPVTEKVQEEINILKVKKLALIPLGLDTGTAPGNRAGGFIYYDDSTGKHVIIINWELAKKAKNFGVIQHEIMHGMLRKTMITNPKLMRRMASVLMKELSTNPTISPFLRNYVLGKGMGYNLAQNPDELFTAMSEYMLQNNYKLSKSFLGSMSDIIRRVGLEFGYVTTVTDGVDIMNFIEDYSREAKRGRFSKGLKKIKEQGLKGKLKLSASDRKKMQEQKAAQSAQSSIYEEERILEDLGLKESSKKIVEENARIRKQILDDNITKDGKVVASPEMQDALIANNMAAAVNLAKFAAANPKIMALEEGKRVSFDQFLSGYYEQLVALARTYDASVNEFGQYMNTMLPLRYGQILKQEKKGEVEGAVSIDAEGVNEVAETDNMTSRLDQSESNRPKVNIAFQAGGETLQKEYEDHYEKGYLLIKNGPAKNQKREEWIKELQDLGFADIDGNIFDIYNVNFADLQDLAVNITSKISGIDADKLNYILNAKASKEGKIEAVKFMANLRIDESRGSNELRTAQMAMRKLGLELFVGPVTPEGFVGTTDKPIGPTKIRPVLQKLLYNKGKKKNNVQMYHKLPVIDIKAIEEAVGIIDSKSFRGDRNISAVVHAFWNQFGRTVASQSLRNVMAKHGDLTDKINVALYDGISQMAQSALYLESSQDQKETIQEVLHLMSTELNRLIVDYKEDNEKFEEKTKELFAESFKDTGIDHQKLHNQLFQKIGLLTIWGNMSKTYELNDMEMPLFKDFIEEEFASLELEQAIFESLGIVPAPGFGKLNKAAAFSKRDVERGRANLVEFAQELKRRVQDENDPMTMEDAMTYLTLLGGMYKSASGISYKQYKPAAKGSIEIAFNLPFVGKVSSRFRPQVFANAKDYYDVINLHTDNFFNISSKNIITLKKDKSKDVINEMVGSNGEFDESRNKQAEKSRALYKEYVIRNWLKYGSKDNRGDRMMFAQLMFAFGSNMESPSRKAAKIWGIGKSLFNFENNTYTGPANPGTTLEYDHNKPHHVLIQRTIEILKNNPESKWDELLDKMFEDFTVSIITKKMNTVIDETGNQSKMEVGYEEGSDMTDVSKGVLGRDFNNKTIMHPDVEPIVEIASKGKVVVGESFVNTKTPNVSKSMQYMEVAKIARSIEYNENTRGISILDFDDTLATSSSLIRYTTPDGTKGTLTPAQYAKEYVALADAGYKFDFSEFNKVVDGKVAPLFNKALKLARKFGTENMFVLTARPAESAPAIYEFLKQNGLEIPLENITGLGNSTGEAKALWIVGKVEEGYNDIYFADDALQNVQAVKNVLEQLDVKSKIQQAKLSKSVEYDEEFNKILEEKSGIAAEKRFSEMKGRKRGEKQGKMKFWIPPSAEDFAGLLYAFLGKGKRGEQQMKFFKKVLLDPYAKAITKLNQAKQQMANEYHELLNSVEGMRKRLNDKIIDDDFIIEDAVRVYLWNKAGYEIPGLSETDKAELIAIVENDEQLLSFALAVGKITRDVNGYTEPGQNWETDGIKHDLFQKSSKIKRDEFLDLFKQNREIIFGKWGGKGGRQLVGANMNKIEAIYGKKFRQALEDIVWRMENGTNRVFGDNKMVNDFMNWLNGSVAAVMFVNTRSAILQTLSTVNFINWEDNNIFAASRAFANQEQFWSDFVYIFNSDFLKQRRSGLTQDLNAAELISHLNKTDNKAKAAIRWMLQKGFAPTQIADSFAIAMGGATFYRNRIGKYIKDGLTEEQAQEKAWTDFQEIAEATQQSARADMISQEQASILGRLILAFQNTPMQYARLTKKAFLDLINGRGDTKSNISKIIYYSFVQNMIFYALQTGLFALMFGGSEEDEELIDKKQARLWNSMLDSTLRGIGVGGAIVSTLKNMALKAAEQDKKGNRADYAYVLIEFFNLSPPVGIKARKIYSATQSWKWSKKEREELGILNIDNPVWEVATGVTEGLFNAPVNRIYNKLQNIGEALDSQNETWKRIAIILGWNAWSVGVDIRDKKDEFGFNESDFDFSDSDFDFDEDDFDFDEDDFDFEEDDFDFDD
jgi:hypothetical protein